MQFYYSVNLKNPAATSNFEETDCEYRAHEFMKMKYFELI